MALTILTLSDKIFLFCKDSFELISAIAQKVLIKNFVLEILHYGHDLSRKSE